MKCMKNICQKMQVVSIYSSSSTVTIWNGDIKDYGRVARKVVDVTCGGVDEENLAIRPHSITFNLAKQSSFVTVMFSNNSSPS